MGRRESWTEREVSAAKARLRLARGTLGPRRESLGRGCTLTTPLPQEHRHEGGGGQGEWRAARGVPLFAWMCQGVRKSTHTRTRTKREGTEGKGRESEPKTDQVHVGGPSAGPGDPLTPPRGPGPGAQWPSSRAIQQPGALLSLGCGLVTAIGLLPSPSGREGRVCMRVLLCAGGAPGFTPRPARSPAPREAASYHLSSPAPPGRAGGKTKGD